MSALEIAEVGEDVHDVLDEVASVFVASFGGPPLFEDWRAPGAPARVEDLLVAYAAHGLLLAARDASGRIVGFGANEPAPASGQLERARAHLRDPEAATFLAELAVAPGHQGNGIGRALCTALIDRAVGDELFLRVALTGDTAGALYRSLGFVALPGTEHEETCPRGPDWPFEGTVDTRILMIHRPDRSAQATRPDRGRSA